MLNILQKLNKKYDNRFVNFKITDAIYVESTKELTVKFHYNCDVISAEDKYLVTNFIKEYFNNMIKVDCKFKKYYIDSEFLTKFLIDYLKENYRNTFVYLTEKDIKVKEKEEVFTIEIVAPTPQYKFIIEANLSAKLNEMFDDIFFNEIIVNFKEIFVEGYENILDEKERYIQHNSNSVPMESVIKLDITNIENFYNEIQTSSAILCSSITAAEDDVFICGVVSNFRVSSFKTKKVDENNNPIMKEYYAFDLVNDNKKLNCVCFVKQADFEKFAELENDKKVVIQGSVEEFNSSISVRVKAVAYCDFTPPVKVVEKKGVPENYNFVFPQSYSKKEQSNMFDLKEEPAKFLTENEVVVFDLETTGVKYIEGHEIIEIGAVKLKNGEIVETFETLIKPKKEIPPEITKINNITNKMVENSISVEQAIPDFYKFCENAVLVAYNIDFDLPFLNHYAIELGYAFDHKYLDAFALAKQSVPGLKNYKLKTVCAHFNVSLENAHRAVFDTIATAEVFIKMAKFI